MRRWLDASFTLMGFSFAVLQALLVRELLVSFSGNELSIGLVLGSWLALEALGSGLASRFAQRIPPRPSSYALLQAILALLVLPTLLAAAHVRALVGAVPGEALAPLPALGGSLLALAPLGLVDGAMFTAACRVLLECAGQGSTAATGRVYALEAFGGIVGGVVFTYALIPFLASTQVILLIAGLNLAMALLLLVTTSPRSIPATLATALLGVAALALLVSPLGADLHRRIAAGRWAPFSLAYEGNSAYGNVAVLKEADQITVFANGTPVLTAPDPDLVVLEQLVHLPALFLDQPPRRALVLGGGAGGVLHELLRYPLQAVDYAEMDPMLIRAVQEVPTPLTAAELGDPRVQIALQDGRRFVVERARMNGTPQYDLILVNLPPPSTLVLNRLYTRDFLEQLRPLLSPQGVLAVPAPPVRTYLAPAAGDLLACYDRTLRAVFSHVRAIYADEQTIWLASAETRLEQLSAAELARRWESLGLETGMLRGAYFTYLLDAGIEASIAAELQHRQDVAVNRDLYPAGLRYALAYESARLSPRAEPFFRALGALRWWHVALGILALIPVGLWARRRGRWVVPLAVATTGLAGMTADLVVILAFQVRYGHVYQQVGLLITAFMAGLGAGGLAMSTLAARPGRPWRVLTALEAGITAAWAGLAGAVALLLSQQSPPSALDQGLLLAMNVVAGALVGLEFPLANRILQRGGEEGSRVAGALYAWDLLGATVGAVAVSAVLLPALGLVQTVLLVALLKAGSLLLVGTAEA